MAEIINTIIEDAKPGMYVCENGRNPYALKDFPPKDYQRAVKVIWYCYDDGSLWRKGIGESTNEDFNIFDDTTEILDFCPSVNFYSTLHLLNEELSYDDLEDFLEALDEDWLPIKKVDFSPKFNELVEYLRTIDIHEEPKTWGEFGFVYTKQEIDGETTYSIRGIEYKDRHRLIK